MKLSPQPPLMQWGKVMGQGGGHGLRPSSQLQDRGGQDEVRGQHGRCEGYLAEGVGMRGRTWVEYGSSDSSRLGLGVTHLYFWTAAVGSGRERRSCQNTTAAAGRQYWEWNEATRQDILLFQTWCPNVVPNGLGDACPSCLAVSVMGRWAGVCPANGMALALVMD